ncbi:phage baseplate assembly protein V [Lacrimispora brassicae]
MREERIVIHPMEYLEILSYEGVKQVNDHAWVRFSGQIPFEKKQECMALGRKQTWMQIAAISGDKEYSLFFGVLEHLQVKVENQTCIVEASLKSGSTLMDTETRIRSFQDKYLTYDKLLEVCGKAYPNSDNIITEGKKKTIDAFIMQYRETDWQFIKRLASKIQTVVVPEYKTEGVKYYFGLPNRNDSISENTCEYTIISDMQEYSKKRAQGLNISQDDTVSYIWEDREIYELGQNKIIDGKEMYISTIKTLLKGDELYHTYYMKTKRGLCLPRQYSQTVAGISLIGSVVKVKHEMVHVKIDKDDNIQSSGYCWFPFATVYSSSDGTGWYCMPEAGDRVRIYFPTKDEAEAYVISAYHEGNAELRQDPDKKFWRNKEGKEIQLTPEHILMTNNHGTYIKLDDDGIEIRSEGSVSIRSKKNMNITSSSGTIELNASKKVRLKQGDTEMDLGGDLSLQGARIKL